MKEDQETVTIEAACQPRVTQSVQEREQEVEMVHIGGALEERRRVGGQFILFYGAWPSRGTTRRRRKKKEERNNHNAKDKDKVAGRRGKPPRVQCKHVRR